MNLTPVNDLKAPRRLREKLEAAGELLITNNGKPMALMIRMEEADDPTTLIRGVREARARIALGELRAAARRAGTSNLRLAEINREIAAVRKARA
jgi:hypothetical protein